VAGRKNAPGLRTNEDETEGRVPALLGETWRWVGHFISPPGTPSDASWSSQGRLSRASGSAARWGLITRWDP